MKITLHIIDIIIYAVLIFIMLRLWVLGNKYKNYLFTCIENERQRETNMKNFIGVHNERLNVLSAENFKLREEKEEMEEKLKNLGLK